MATLTLEKPKRAYMLVNSIIDSDDYFTPAVIAKIELAMQQYKEGKYTVINNKEELHHFFNSL